MRLLKHNSQSNSRVEALKHMVMSSWHTHSHQEAVVETWNCWWFHKLV